MTDYIGAEVKNKWHIGIVDRRKNDRYLIKWTSNETGETLDWWRSQDWLDNVAAGKYPFWTLTMPKPDPQTQLREWLKNVTDYIGAKVEIPWHIGIVDHRENDRYFIKWTSKETGDTWDGWWPRVFLDNVAAGKYPGETLTIPKPDPQTQLREWIKNYD